MLSLKKVSLWPLPARLAAAALVAALVAMLLHLAWLDGLFASVHAADGEEARLRSAYQLARTRAGQLPAWRERQRLAGAELARLEQQLPDSQQMAELLSDINAAGQSRGVQFALFKPAAPQPLAHYVALPITVQLRGGYHAMGELMADLARLPRIVTVHGLALTGGKDGMVTLDGVLQAYRLPDAQERAAQARLPAVPVPAAQLAWQAAPAFVPRAYEGAAFADPFGASLPVQGAAGGGVAGPDWRRRREALESVAMPALSMVGSVRHAGRLSALLLAGQRVHRVEVGQHLGQDHGVVTGISEQALQYRELLREADGPWRERRGSLALQAAGAAAVATPAATAVTAAVGVKAGVAEAAP